MTHTPEVSIVIPVYNEGDLIRQTLEAINTGLAIPAEIIVVDDGSTDSCCNFLLADASAFENIRTIRQKKAGIATARNQGAKQAQAEVVVFLDAHCFPQAGWLERLLAVLDIYSDGILAPCISSVKDTRLRGFGLKLTDRAFGYKWLNKRSDMPYEIPIAGGACMVMKKAFFHAIGGFDTMRGFGVEDVEICIRSWTFGFPVILVPDVEVQHVFKLKANSLSGWQNYVYNALRTALLHFDDTDRSQIVDYLKTKPGFSRATTEVLLSDIWERYGFIRATRNHDTRWFCEKFSIDI